MLHNTDPESILEANDLQNNETDETGLQGGDLETDYKLEASDQMYF